MTCFNETFCQIMVVFAYYLENLFPNCQIINDKKTDCWKGRNRYDFSKYFNGTALYIGDCYGC